MVTWHEIYGYHGWRPFKTRKSEFAAGLGDALTTLANDHKDCNPSNSACWYQVLLAENVIYLAALLTEPHVPGP